MGPQAKSYYEMERMTPDMRDAVNEYGLPIVRVLMKFGIKQKKHVDEIVREIWAGARSSSQRRSPGSTLDWYLTQAGVQINTAGLARIMAWEGMIIVPRNATVDMINASMNTVSGHSIVCSKHEKHKLRLDAALEVGSKHLFRLRPTKRKDAA